MSQRLLLKSCAKPSSARAGVKLDTDRESQLQDASHLCLSGSGTLYWEAKHGEGLATACSPTARRKADFARVSSVHTTDQLLVAMTAQADMKVTSKSGDILGQNRAVVPLQDRVHTACKHVYRNSSSPCLLPSTVRYCDVLKGKMRPLTRTLCRFENLLL